MTLNHQVWKINETTRTICAVKINGLVDRNYVTKMFLTFLIQVYRHVDSVMFENSNIVERFLSYWRSSGYQRMGLLYGNYEEHGDVPLGIR